MNVLLAPQISEKATYVAEKNEQVIFRVASDATKPEIKAAVEMMFKVNVDSVQVATSRASKSVSAVSSGVARTGRRPMCAWRRSGNQFCRKRARINIMALIKLKPTSPGRRAVVRVVNPDLHKGKPVAALLEKQEQDRRPQP